MSTSLETNPLETLPEIIVFSTSSDGYIWLSPKPANAQSYLQDVSEHLAEWLHVSAWGDMAEENGQTFPFRKMFDVAPMSKEVLAVALAEARHIVASCAGWVLACCKYGLPYKAVARGLWGRSQGAGTDITDDYDKDDVPHPLPELHGEFHYDLSEGETQAYGAHVGFHMIPSNMGIVEADDGEDDGDDDDVRCANCADSKAQSQRRVL